MNKHNYFKSKIEKLNLTEYVYSLITITILWLYIIILKRGFSFYINLKFFNKKIFLSKPARSK